MVRVHENSPCVRSVRGGQGTWGENSPCVRSVRGGQGT